MDEQIIERLCKLRKQHGYSQEQLADELGVSRQAISKWERGEASPDTDNLIALARLYNISVDDLLFEKSAEAIAEPAVKIAESADTVEPVEPVGPDKEGTKEGRRRRYHDNAAGVAASVTVMLSCIVYFLLGGIWHLWHPAWIVFLAIPVVPTLVSAIQERDPNVFCFPVLVTAVYLLLGCQWGLWHPWWVIFFTVPVYYVIADFIKKK